MDLQTFRADDWQNFWAGSWCFLTCSQFTDQFTQHIRFGDRPFIPQSIILVSNGKSQGWGKTSDKKILGDFLVEQVVADESIVPSICTALKEQADVIRDFMNSHKTGSITPAIYNELWDHVIAYYKPHINVKYVVDYLDPARLETYLPVFQDARLYAETVLDEVEQFVRRHITQLAEKTAYPFELLWCLTKEERARYVDNGTLPDEAMLTQRNNRAAIISNEEETVYVWGDDLRAIDEILHGPTLSEEVRGSTAYGGTVRGRVRVVLDPKDADDFAEGDILVTGMTRPDFLPLMKQAAAFVTNSGGILSHAAIVAREMKKPCVIGTKHATRVFADGDQVEVDADSGVVKRI